MLRLGTTGTDVLVENGIDRGGRSRAGLVTILGVALGGAELVTTTIALTLLAILLALILTVFLPLAPPRCDLFPQSRDLVVRLQTTASVGRPISSCTPAHCGSAAAARRASQQTARTRKGINRWECAWGRDSTGSEMNSEREGGAGQVSEPLL